MNCYLCEYGISVTVICAIISDDNFPLFIRITFDELILKFDDL